MKAFSGRLDFPVSLSHSVNGMDPLNGQDMRSLSSVCEARVQPLTVGRQLPISDAWRDGIGARTGWLVFCH